MSSRAWRLRKKGLLRGETQLALVMFLVLVVVLMPVLMREQRLWGGRRLTTASLTRGPRASPRPVQPCSAQHPPARASRTQPGHPSGSSFWRPQAGRFDH